MSTIAAGASAVLTVTDGATVTLVSGPQDVARLTITTGPEAGKLVVSQHAGRRRYGPFGAGTVTLQAVSGYCTYYISTDGADDAERAVTAVTLDATDLSGLNTAGKPIATGVFLKDPTTKLVYGQSDGAGSYEALGGGGVVDGDKGEVVVTESGTVWTLNQDVLETAAEWVIDGLAGAALGLAELGADGKVPSAQLPESLGGGLSYQGVWNATTNTPTIPTAVGNTGEYYKVSVAGTTSIDGIASWAVGDWIISNGATWDKIDNTETVSSVAGRTGAITLAKADVGLGNLDNTSDANKPVSTATQTALNLKANLASPALTGTPTTPTAALGTNTTQIASTAFVATEIEAAALGSLAVQQFGVVHSGLMPTPVRMSASGTPSGFSTPCLVESIMCLTVGTGGPVTIHDDVDAADAAQLRFTRAVGDMVAGTVYPLAGDGAAVVFVNGIYFTNSTSGVYILNAVPEVTA